MRQAAKEAYETLLHGRDGQLCDVILDRAALGGAIAGAGEKSRVQIIKDYARSLIVVSDIRIAVRCCRTGKPLEFMKRAMAECEELKYPETDAGSFAGRRRHPGLPDTERNGEAAEALAQSSLAFECWCDNQLMETIRPQKYNPFSVGGR